MAKFLGSHLSLAKICTKTALATVIYLSKTVFYLGGLSII